MTIDHPLCLSSTRALSCSELVEVTTGLGPGVGLCFFALDSFALGAFAFLVLVFSDTFFFVLLKLSNMC